MNNELLAVLEYLEQERGIDREVLVQAIESALMSASKKSIHPANDLDVKVDPRSGDIKAWAKLEVVDAIPTCDQIVFERAKEKNPEVQLGDVISWEVTPKNFGRIAAQTAKQAISQLLRRAEKEAIRDEFEPHLGEILNGQVRSIEGNNIIVEIGKTEGVISARDRIQGEQYMAGNRINAVLVKVDISNPGPPLVLSRSHSDFVKRLFEQEVSEIHDNVVEIKGIAREAGGRTKIAVTSNDDRVDPIGACVGMRGMRVKAITQELGGERMDIIRWDEDIAKYAISSLQPAEPKRVEVNEERKSINVYVTPEESRKAFGKKAQNVRLASKLLGWGLNIITEEIKLETNSFDDQIEKTIEHLSETLQIDFSVAEKLVNNGFVSPAGIKGAELDDLTEIEGIELEDAEMIMNAVSDLDE